MKARLTYPGRSKVDARIERGIGWELIQPTDTVTVDPTDSSSQRCRFNLSSDLGYLCRLVLRAAIA